MNELAVNGAGKALIDGITLTRKNVEKEINAVIVRLNETNDTREIDTAITSLTGINKFSVSATIQALTGYAIWYEDTDQEDLKGESFLDMVMAKHEFDDRNVIERYITLHKSYAQGLLPEELKDLNLKDQIAICVVAEDDQYEITDEYWEKLIYAVNGAEVRRILREIKGKPPTKGSYMGHLSPDGIIYYWHQGEKVICGQIAMPNGNEEDDSIEQRVYRKNRTRIINGAGLTID